MTRQTLAQNAVAAAPYDIRQDDCIRFLRGLAEESVDLIVTDPAYSGMNQHMQFGHGRIVGHYRGNSGDGRWLEEFHDDPDSYRAFLGECHVRGSGSAAIAALRNGCRFVGADIADRTVTMARARCTAYLAEGVDPLEPAADGGLPRLSGL